MTTGELLIALFQAYKDKNDDAFMKAAITLIDEEKAKNHYVLANNLKKILSSPSTSSSRWGEDLQIIFIEHLICHETKIMVDI